MYLSRLNLNTDSRTTRELRINPYLLHQAVFRAFPDAINGGAGRVLYRMDINRQGKMGLLVQSEKAPNWTTAEILSSCLSEPAEFKNYAPSFYPGQQLNYLLRANPTVKKAKPEQPDITRRQGLLREEDQLKWFTRKAENGGFSIVSCQTIPEGIVQDERGKKESGKLRHYGVRFEGVLSVADPAAFEVTLQNGIGAAKGFGFGLLSIAPVKD